MNPSQSLDVLGRLDRTFLHLFLVGPGVGEGIAVALPETGWLLIDGCRSGRSLPLRKILERWRSGDDDHVRAMVLTHPHDDHCAGFAELVDAFQPEHVIVSGCKSPKQHLVDYLEALFMKLPPDETCSRLPAQEVLLAVKGIRTWEATHPGRLIGACDGFAIPLGNNQAQALVRAPHEAGLDTFFAAGNLAQRLLTNANHLSTVIEVIFGATQIVLGGDLPHLDNGVVVETGWEGLLQRHTHLQAPVSLKVSHHGSVEALHPGLQPSSALDRTWALTPYNRSHLPRREGLDRLLGWHPRLHVTRLPSALAATGIAGHGPHHVRAGTLASTGVVAPIGDPIIDAGQRITSPRRLGPLDGTWVFVFDEAAVVRARYGGAAALDIVP